MFCWDGSYRKKKRKKKGGELARAPRARKSVCQLEWGGNSHSYVKKASKKSCSTLLPPFSQLLIPPPCLCALLPAALSQSLWGWNKRPAWIFFGSGWTMGVLRERPLAACTLSADLPHGLFFLTGQKGEEQGQREGGSCRLPGAVRLQLSLAVPEWASRW